MINPNKHIRNYFLNTLNNVNISGQEIPCFDSRQATMKHNICYLLLDQDNQREPDNKCHISTTQNLTVEVIERVARFGNQGNRDFLDDASNEVYSTFDNMNITGFQIFEKSLSDQSVVTYDKNEIIKRNIITLTFKIE